MNREDYPDITEYGWRVSDKLTEFGYVQHFYRRRPKFDVGLEGPIKPDKPSISLTVYRDWVSWTWNHNKFFHRRLTRWDDFLILTYVDDIFPPDAFFRIPKEPSQVKRHFETYAWIMAESSRTAKLKEMDDETLEAYMTGVMRLRS